MSSMNFMTQPSVETFVRIANLMGYIFGMTTGHLSCNLEKTCLWMEYIFKQLKRHLNQSKVIKIWLQKFISKSENLPLHVRVLLSCYNDDTVLNCWGICLRMKPKELRKPDPRGGGKDKSPNNAYPSSSWMQLCLKLGFSPMLLVTCPPFFLLS